MSLWDIMDGIGSAGYGGRYGGMPTPAPMLPADAATTIDTKRLGNRADQAESRVDHLLLVVEAMWELLSARFGVTTDELIAKVREIDGRDGKVDGKRSRGVSQRACPGCRAVVPAGMTKCQFCGAEAPTPPDPFEI